MDSNSSNAIELSDAVVMFGKQRVFDEVNLGLPAGTLLWLSGANGAGKSTLLRAIAGLLPFNGEIKILGFAPGSLDARKQAIFVPDEPALYEDLTLREHAEFTAGLYGQPGALERILHWLEVFELDHRLDEFPASHSRGMRQKLSLALALGLELPVTLLDEPFNGLDAASQLNLQKAILGLLEKKLTVAFSAHQTDITDGLRKHARCVVASFAEGIVTVTGNALAVPSRVA
jgi:ABC-2 type transport system ATP-binding protein